MDKGLEQYYLNYFDLFMTEGWRQFVEDIKETHESVNNLQNIKDSEDFYYKKGQEEILRRFLNFKDLIESSYKETQDESVL